METPARRALAGTSLGTPATAQLSSAALRSRHSLYGAEDRVILELGHALARVGYSGESAPRHAQYIKDAWCDRKAHAASEDDWQLLEHVLKLTLRQLFHECAVALMAYLQTLLTASAALSHLKTDPRTRKVLVVEPVLMPTSVKALIARLLFDNLQVPSLNFASAPVLSLMASGALTGLVLDVGHAEASVTPVSRATSSGDTADRLPAGLWRQALAHLGTVDTAGGRYRQRPPPLAIGTPCELCRATRHSFLCASAWKPDTTRACRAPYR